nr:unnamed protein product [Callosobruchus analis]
MKNLAALGLILGLLSLNIITLTSPLLKLKMLTNPALFAQTVGPITSKNLLLLGLVPVVGGLGALQSNAYHLGQGFLNLIPPQPYY